VWVNWPGESLGGYPELGVLVVPAWSVQGGQEQASQLASGLHCRVVIAWQDFLAASGAPMAPFLVGNCFCGFNFQLL